MNFRAALIVVALTAAAACGERPPKSEAERTVTDDARGIRYLVPPGWKSHDAEIRSPAGTLLTVRVYDLVEAEKRFVQGLPDTLIPQLTEWAKYYYIVEGDYTREATTVAGLPATELNYPIRVRPKDPPSKVTYWIIRREDRLFVLRAAYPPGGLADDERSIRTVIGAWAFLPAGGA
jgi:hypothetical protein